MKKEEVLEENPKELQEKMEFDFLLRKFRSIFEDPTVPKATKDYIYEQIYMSYFKYVKPKNPDDFMK